MGRMATAFMVLAAVGGCVADDQGPSAAVLAAQHGGPTAVVAPTYATWNRTEQFAVLQDAPATVTPIPTVAAIPTPPAPAAVRMTTTTTLKPTAVRKPIVPAPADSPAPLAPAEPPVDPDLVQATMVQVPGNATLANRDAAPPAPAPTAVKPTATRKSVVVPAPVDSGVATEPLPDLEPLPTAPTPAQVVNDAPAREPAAPRPNIVTHEAEQTAANLASASTRMVNSKRITLNYELKDAADAGLTGVELWCTQDTRTWKKGEIVAQTNHSYTVEVKDEGLYGFTLLTRGGVGGKDSPQPGDQPQVWVSVDVTKPTVQITSLELTHAGRVPALMIRWTAKDKNMGPRPISLAYAEETEGPWTPIVAGLENNGQYEWQPLNGVPHHLYIRVEAADLHGNVGMAQTANPLRIDTAGAPAALPQAETTVRRPAPSQTPAPLPAVESPRSGAAILAVEPNGN